MNITLIGMAGAGKSVIGKKIAEILNYKFIDTDEIIEQKTGLKLQQIIDQFGDEEFLKIEEGAILGLGKIENCVISPGGSVVYIPKAMEFLKKNSIVVFLDAAFKDIEKRLENKNTRGIVGLKNKSLKTLFQERLGLYKKYADTQIKLPRNFNADHADQTAKGILATLQHSNILQNIRMLSK